MASFDETPDKPTGFGFKVLWFAVKATDPASVLDALEFGERTPANWASGLATVYGDQWVFASPPVSGWILVVGLSLPYPTNETHHDIGKRFDVLFSRLMQRFDDVQFFGSHRVSDFVTWARAVNGKPMRTFAWSGSNGEVLANFGEQTPEEAKLGFINLTGLSPSDAVDRIFKIVGEQQDEADALVASGLIVYCIVDVTCYLPIDLLRIPDIAHAQRVQRLVACRFPRCVIKVIKAFRSRRELSGIRIYLIVIVLPFAVLFFCAFVPFDSGLTPVNDSAKPLNFLCRLRGCERLIFGGWSFGGLPGHKKRVLDARFWWAASACTRSTGRKRPTQFDDA
jgi:hypothetical protein